MLWLDLGVELGIDDCLDILQVLERLPSGCCLLLTIRRRGKLGFA